MDMEKYVAKYYSRFVFTSPKLSTLIVLYLFILILIIISKTQYFSLTTLSIAVILPIIISNAITAFLLRNSVLRFKNYVRRVLVMLIFILLHVFVFELVVMMFTFKKLYLITYGGYAFLHYVLRRPECDFVKAMFESILPPITYYALVLPMFEHSLATMSFTILTPFISASFGEVYFVLLRKYSKTGKLTLALSNAFLRLWFAEDSKPIEKILESISDDDSVWVKLFIIYDVFYDKVRGIIALTSIHAGPFRDTGSSKVISELRKVLKEIYGNIPVLIFHAATTHEKDIPSVKYLKYVISQIRNALRENHRRILDIDTIYGFEKLCDKQYCMYFIELDKVPLVVLYNLTNGIDDLPSHLNEVLENIAKKAGFEDLLVIEAHNAKPEVERNIEKECKSYIKIFKDNVSNIQRKDTKNKDILKIGLSEIEDPRLNDCIDLCSNIVNAIVFDHHGKLSIIVVYDGNNATKDFKDEVESEIKKLHKNIAFATIVTTDNHEKTGSLGGKTYVPVGASICRNEIIKTTITAVKKALSSLTESKIVFRRIDILTKTLGYQGFRFLENIAEDLRLIVPLFFVLHISSFLVSFLIAFIY